MLFRNPIKTIEHIASAPDTMGGFLAAIICSMVLMCKFIVIFSKYGIGLNATAVGYLLLSSILIQMIIWIALSLIISFSIRLAGGIGSFRDITSIFGYGQIYLVVAHLASLIAVIATPVSYDVTQTPTSLGGAAIVYVPFYLFIGVLVGYGVSFTHMLKKITAIGATMVAIMIFIIFFYII